MVAAEFEKLGIDASTSEITTSACVAGDYLSSKGVEGSYVYVIGEPALMSMLSERAGVRPIGGPDDAGKSKRTLQSEGHSGSRARGKREEPARQPSRNPVGTRSRRSTRPPATYRLWSSARTATSRTIRLQRRLRTSSATHAASSSPPTQTLRTVSRRVPAGRRRLAERQPRGSREAAEVRPRGSRDLADVQTRSRLREFLFTPRVCQAPTLAPAGGVWARCVAMTSGREPDIVCGEM